MNDATTADPERTPRIPGRLRLRHVAEAAELAVIRRRVRRWAEQNELPDAAAIDLQLALGEAVSNGVDHAYRNGETGAVDIDLELRADGGVRVRVFDYGQWRPVPMLKGYRGRGLAMIEALSERLRICTTGVGTQICFDIPAGT